MCFIKKKPQKITSFNCNVLKMLFNFGCYIFLITYFLSLLELKISSILDWIQDIQENNRSLKDVYQIVCTNMKLHNTE